MNNRSYEKVSMERRVVQLAIRKGTRGQDELYVNNELIPGALRWIYNEITTGTLRFAGTPEANRRVAEELAALLAARTEYVSKHIPFPEETP